MRNADITVAEDSAPGASDEDAPIFPPKKLDHTDFLDKQIKPNHATRINLCGG